MVYGGGSYDGQTNLSPMPDVDDNRVLRAYLVPAFHPHPATDPHDRGRRRRMVQVLANLDEVERVTVVEINPGYVEVMRETPALASALSNPKVEIVIDDGRRWLTRTDRQLRRHHPEHHRLLARLRRQPAVARVPGALAPAPGARRRPLLNATYSAAAQKTGAAASPVCTQVPEHDPRLGGADRDRPRALRARPRRLVDRRPARAARRHHRGRLDLLREQDWRGVATWEDRDAILRRTADQPIITDDNMANEWRDLTLFP